MDNPFDFKPIKFPDLRRKVGEWREIVDKDGILYVESASEYIAKGDGVHNPNPIHEALGLKSVTVSFGNMKIIVNYIMNDGRTELLEFDIDFAGFGP